MGFLGRLFSGSKPSDAAIGAAVLLSERTPVDLDEVARRLASRGREVGWENGLLTLGDVQVTILQGLPAMPAPLLDELASSAWWWEDAKEACRGHAQVVAVQVAEGRGDRVTRRRAVSDVAALVARVAPAVAVVWNDAAGLYEAPVFCEHVEAAAADEAPTAFWISLRIAEVGRRRVFVSTGLSAFAHREIEIDVPPRNAEDFARVLHDLFRIIVLRGGRMTVGQTLQLSEQLGLRVVEVGASSLPGRPDVIQLAVV